MLYLTVFFLSSSKYDQWITVFQSVVISSHFTVFSSDPCLCSFHNTPNIATSILVHVPSSLSLIFVKVQVSVPESSMLSTVVSKETYFSTVLEIPHLYPPYFCSECSRLAKFWSPFPFHLTEPETKTYIVAEFYIGISLTHLS